MIFLIRVRRGQSTQGFRYWRTVTQKENKVRMENYFPHTIIFFLVYVIVGKKEWILCWTTWTWFIGIDLDVNWGKKGNCNNIVRQEFCVISSEIDKGFLVWILTLNQSFVNRNVWNAQIYNCIHSSKLTIKWSKQYQHKTDHISNICNQHIFPKSFLRYALLWVDSFYDNIR